jgi:glutathione S-transferase
MPYVALVTLVLLGQYVVFMALCGKARAQGGVKAPAVTGDQTFERAYRVQMNTLEQLAITLPSMWICGHYFDPMWAAGFGLVFFFGRILYRAAYMADPQRRGPGMIIGFLANVALILTGLWGLLGQL